MSLHGISSIVIQLGNLSYTAAWIGITSINILVNIFVPCLLHLRLSFSFSMSSFPVMLFVIILLLASMLVEGMVSLKWLIISDILNNSVKFHTT